MRIAICDDDALELARIGALLERYRQERNIHLTYQSYQSAAELLSHVKSGQYDLLLLDILMPGLTGLDAAREVRGFDSGVSIVFLTSSPEFALESYAVKARDYMLKPVGEEKIFSVLDAVLAEEQACFDGISIKTKNGMARILFLRLAYVEVNDKRLYFHLADGTVREVTAPLVEYESRLLAQRSFLKVHRSYLVNLWQMADLTADGFVTHRGEIIPISRLLYGAVRRAFMSHLFLEMGEAQHGTGGAPVTPARR